MKSYTNIEQSKKLAKILPIDTADCCYIMYCTSDNPEWRYEGQPPMFLGDIPITEIEAEHIPCWSLTTLFNVMPKTLEYGRPILGTNYEGFYFVQYRDASMDYVNGTSCYNNPIDACYEMIMFLHKENLI